MTRYDIDLLLCSYKLIKIRQQKGEREIKKILGNSIKTDYICRCQTCGNNIRNSKMAIISNLKYRQICNKCAISLGYKRCNECGKFKTPDYKCSCQEKKAIRPKKERYNFQANWKNFQINKNDVILIGIEIEVEGEGQSMTKSKKLYEKPWIIYKHDGSLSQRGEAGFEIVTMPLGWEWIKKNKKEFDDLFNLAKFGYKSRCTNTCGMHVHLAKSIFTTYHLYKFYQFHYMNKHLLYLLSGRSWSNMIRWASFQYDKEIDIKAFAKTKYSSERHSAINLMNPESVEIRIFRGTLSPAPFWRNIEFVKSVYDYTRYLNMREVKNIELYKNYIEKNKKEFPYLNEFLNKDLKGEILCV